MAYIYQYSFGPLERLPLSLTQGDVESNLDRLSACEDIASLYVVYKKTHTLLVSGYPRHLLISALTFAQQAPCSTNLVEENHAAVALNVKFHPKAGEGQLRARSVVYQARQLGPSHTHTAAHVDR